jgi:3-hydroxyacyl-[acyl-carrier-protein] dehydratase
MANTPPDPAIIQQVKTILRRDLKLGPDTPIADDMSFHNNDIDLDSLDMLLLLTSVEKEFGLKVPGEDVGRSIFENVTTLARYIQDHGGSSGNGASASAPAAAPVNPLALLPHAEPFRFITAVQSIQPDQSAEGVWSLTGSETFFAGHFPGRPLVPGVLIAEALAQLSGLVVGKAGTAGMLVHVDVRFDHPVTPPADIVLHSRAMRSVAPLFLFEVSAAVGDTVVARGTLALQLQRGENR